MRRRYGLRGPFCPQQYCWDSTRCCALLRGRGICWSSAARPAPRVKRANPPPEAFLRATRNRSRDSAVSRGLREEVVMSGETPAETVLPVAEESLHLGKHPVETGRVRVALSTETVEEVLRETLRTQRAEVERRPMGQTVTEVPRIRREGDVVIIPVVEEVLVVEKRLVLREEIRLHLIESETEIEHPASRRVQHAKVERVPPVPDESSR
jgi:stress response protein YsnF